MKLENVLTKTLRHVDVSAAQGEKRASINEMFLWVVKQVYQTANWVLDLG